jgi:nodulation protein E
MSEHRVVVTGLGCVSAAGHDAEQTWTQVLAGASAIRPQEVARADRKGIWPVATVRDWDGSRYFSGPTLMRLDPFAQYALVAAREAMAAAGWGAQLPQADETAVVLGTGGGGEGSREEAAVQLFGATKGRCHPMLVPRSNSQAAVGAVAMEWGCRGPAFTVSTGCASGTHAIAQAALLVRAGVARRAITGGSEASVIYGVLKAFEAVRVLSCDTCRPFDDQRLGMALGEGAGVLVLERYEDALARGAPILAELAGWGLSADAHDAVHPHPEGCALAMRRALAHAELTPERIGYINAHGTGTPVNDATEAQAIRDVFGAAADQLPVSSTKAVHGHALGATGAIEAVIALLALKHRKAPPNANLRTADPACPIHVVAREPEPVRTDAVLSNSFAFGGLNACLVFRGCA